MRARRVWAGVAAAGVLAGLGAVGASPASAAEPLSAGCQSLNGAELGVTLGAAGTDSSTFTAVLNAGELVTATVGGITGGPIVVTVSTGGVTFLTATRVGARGEYVTPSSATYVIQATGNFDAAGEFFVQMACQQAPEAAPIPAWHQAYARGADETCLDGWSPSWHSWAERVTGGWVCHRSIPSLG